MKQIERSRVEKLKLERELNEILNRKLTRYCQKYNVMIENMILRPSNNFKYLEISVDYNREYRDRD